MVSILYLIPMTNTSFYKTGGVFILLVMLLALPSRLYTHGMVKVSAGRFKRGKKSLCKTWGKNIGSDL